MYIPPSASSSIQPTSFLSADDSQSSREKWSSLIGVTTAIIGNVLISFALNTQRYAHIRLSREQEEQEEKRRKARRRGHKKGASYGTQQSDVADERAEVNAKAEPMREDLEVGQGDGAGGDGAVDTQVG